VRGDVSKYTPTAQDEQRIPASSIAALQLLGARPYKMKGQHDADAHMVA
jgi:hypothetical protein